MKSVAIFRHAATEGPGYFSEFLEEKNIPWTLITVDSGEAVPTDASLFSGLVFMGGPMSVNDDLPWIPPVLELIRDGFSKDIPLLGHCLGGQLISKALGGVVTRNPVKEIGWGEVNLSDNEAARLWFGDVDGFQSFHWHGETFSMPTGAIHLLSSKHCANQAYAIGKHLAMQCHIEMTTEMISKWCEVGVEEIMNSCSSPAVQTTTDMLAQMENKLPKLREVATRVYTHWTASLR